MLPAVVFFFVLCFALFCFVLFCFFCYTGEVVLHSNSTSIAEMLLLNVANWKMRNGKRGTENEERGTGNGEPMAAVFPIKMLNFTNMNPYFYL